LSEAPRPRPARKRWIMRGQSSAALGAVRGLVRRSGFDLVRYTSERFPHLRRRQVIGAESVSLVLDVGASVGEYAEALRRNGYGGRIVSLEPLTTAFAELERRARDDAHWECRQLALGDSQGFRTINVAGNLVSSSFLAMTSRHVASAPDSTYVGREEVQITRLDSLRGDLFDARDKIYLKLDVQGFELPVMRGARLALPQVRAVEAELSLVTLYEGQELLPEVVASFRESGFVLVALEPAFADPHSGELLQMDGFFVRSRPG
jgi:FkbM family methyltransferase